MSWTLYRHTSPSGKVYIGITSRPVEKRWANGRGYLITLKNGKYNLPVFARAIIKYGWSNIKHEILFSNLSEKRAKKLETELIRHYKSLGISYNITDGGEGALGRHPTLETKQKLRQSSLGRTHVCSEKTRQTLKLIHTDKYSCNSVYLTLEFRNKISKCVEYKKKKVTLYTINNEFVAFYSSATEAQRVTGIDRGSILRCCKGKVNRAGKFKWRFS